jgi:hypothetical protein
VSQNDGTSKIIQDEVEKELEEMYIRQEQGQGTEGEDLGEHVGWGG